VREDSAGTDRTVRSATRADVPELAAVLSHAFANEPPFTWVQPDDELRARVQPAMSHGALRYIYPVERGTEVLLENGAIQGGAILGTAG
jgi:ribosomal protein S18 acetylase RimI-like enzyme